MSMESPDPNADSGSEDQTLRHFSRQFEIEDDEKIYVWRDVWPENLGGGDEELPPMTVWILENPLGMGKYGVRTARIPQESDLATIEESEHIAAADTEGEAKEAAIEWMAQQCSGQD